MRVNQKWLLSVLTSWCYSSSEIFDIMVAALQCPHNGEIEDIIAPPDRENPAEVIGYRCALCGAELEDTENEDPINEMPF